MDTDIDKEEDDGCFTSKKSPRAFVDVELGRSMKTTDKDFFKSYLGNLKDHAAKQVEPPE